MTIEIARAPRAALRTLAVCAAGMALWAAPSWAVSGYAPVGQFGEPGSGDGQLSGLEGIAVDEATGDIYVSDTGNRRVQEFDATGKYIRQFDGSQSPTGELGYPYRLAVDNSKGPGAGDVYVLDGEHSVVDVFSPTGEYLRQLTGTPAAFGILQDVTVDAAEDVWVYQLVEEGGRGEYYGQVDEFSDTGSFLGMFKTDRGAGAGLAVDSHGDFYLLFASGAVGKYTASGEQLAEWGSSAGSLAVNPSTDNVFVAVYGAAIEEFGPFGEPIGEVLDRFTSETGLSGYSGGVAVNGSDGTVYASESGADRVAIFKDVGLLADASTGAAGEIGKGEATISGSVKRNGLPTKYHFVYGETSLYGSSSSSASVSGEEETVSLHLTGLHAETTYHYQLVAENEHGRSFGGDQTFTTGGPAVEQLSTGAASAVTVTSATVSGALAPDGLDTHYYFEYGESEAYGSLSPALPGTDAGSASRLETAETQLSGLEPSTTYHYRLVGVDVLGVTHGQDMAFKTLPVVATVGAQPPAVSSVTRTSVLVTGAVDTHNSLVEYRVEYVDAGEYQPGAADPYASGASSQAATVEPARGAQSAGPVPIAGLLAGTTYHYRVAATNGAGTVYGSDQTFATAPATPPLVTTGAASEVTQTGVLLSGLVDTRELQTSYEFEVGTDATYGGAKLFGDAGAAGVEAVSAELGFLIPGTTYHYRLVATNEDGTSYGQEMTFTTPGVAADLSQPPAAALIPSPVVLFPSTAGAITKPQGASKKQTKRKKQVKRKARRRKRAGGQATGGKPRKGGAKRR
jgi:NHL repeat